LPGLAHASPIISGDRIYIATAVGPSDKELKVGLYGDIEPVEESGKYQWRLLALDRSSGETLWNVLGHEAVPRVKRHPKSTHCNSTPATDGWHIVTIFGSEGLFCFDRDGKLLWKKDLGPMDSGFFSVPSAQWGFASSPVIHEGKVVVLCDVQTNSFIATYDIASGKKLWSTSRNDVPTWGCPTIVEHGDRTQIAVNGWHHSGGYALEDGKELWRLDGGGDIPVPTPVFENGLIYLTSAHGRLRPMRAIRPDATGDITPARADATNAAIAWVHPRQGNYMQTPIVISNRVYGCTDSGVLTCFDADNGNIIYSERLGGPIQGYTASPVSDGRHLYFAGETGKVLVVPVGDQFSVIATNDLGDNCMATPAISDGALLFRTQKKLIAVADD
jgi:outer membrane protein assembly factor BamB